MSIEAMQWAFNQDIKPSSMKFVLVSLGDNAQHDGIAWPSIAALCKKTGQDRKTVIASLDRLEKDGYLRDSGKRTGSTNQIKVYIFNFSRKNSTVFPINDSENGTLKEDETVPFFPDNSTVSAEKSAVFPHKSTENGTRNPQEPPKETTRNPHKDLFGSTLPDWLPMPAWNAFLEMRKKIKKPATDYAIELLLQELSKIHKSGQDVEAVLNQSIRSNWSDVYPMKTQNSKNKNETIEETNARVMNEFLSSENKKIDVFTIDMEN